MRQLLPKVIGAARFASENGFQQVACVMYVLLGLLLALDALAVPVAAAGRQYALLVGVRAYPRSDSLNTLPYAERDTEALAPVLKNMGYQVTLMTYANSAGPGNERFSPQATLIRKEIEGLVNIPFMKNTDSLLVVLCGHGIQLTSRTDPNQTRFYFCATDAEIKGLQHLEDVTEGSNLISIEELYQSINGCNAGLKLLVVDACRNDPNKPSEFRDAKSVTRPPIPTPPGGMKAIFSCSSGQKAREDKDLGHGVFSYFLIQGLSGEADLNSDGELKLTELEEYTVLNTYEYVRVKHSTFQKPEVTGTIQGPVSLGSLSRKVQEKEQQELARQAALKKLETEKLDLQKKLEQQERQHQERLKTELAKETALRQEMLRKEELRRQETKKIPAPVTPPPITPPSSQESTAINWKSNWNYSQKEFEAVTAEYKDQGFRIHDLEVYLQHGKTLFSTIYHENTDNRGWWAVWRNDSKQFDKAFQDYRQQYRMTDIEVLNEPYNGVENLVYSGVWVENKENLQWVSRWNLTVEEWNKEFEQYRNEGYIPVDIEVYTYQGKEYFACIWSENPAGRAWEMTWGQPHEAFQKKYDEMAEKGYRTLDLESYIFNGKFYYAGIWETDTTDGWAARWNLTYDEYTKHSSEFTKSGRMPTHFYSYSKDGETYYGGVWSTGYGELLNSQTKNSSLERDSVPPATLPEAKDGGGGL